MEVTIEQCRAEALTPEEQAEWEAGRRAIDADVDLQEYRRLIKVDRAYAERASRLWQVLPHRAHGYVSAVHHRTAWKFTPAMEALRDWYGSFDVCSQSRIAVLAGPPGTGKTVAACWLAYARLLRDEQEIRFFTAMELARMPRHGEARQELLAYAGEATIIDDLGAEQLEKRSSNAWLADLDELIDAIYRSLSGIAVITTNCSSADFRRRYGARVMDRLAECGTWIPVLGKSMRGQR